MDETPLYFLILSLLTALIGWVLWWRGRASCPPLPSSTLGILHSTHRKAYRTALAGGCILLVLGGFPLMIGLAWMPDRDGWMLAACGLALVLSGSAVVWRALVNRSIRIDHYRDGLIYHHRSTVSVIPWSAMVTIKRHRDPRTYALILETISAGRIDLAGIHDGNHLTDAILLATAHRRATPAWNPGGHRHIRGRRRTAEPTAPAGVGERIFAAVGSMLMLLTWVGSWVLYMPLQPYHVIGGVLGLALGVIGMHDHIHQQDNQTQHGYDPYRPVPRFAPLDILSVFALVVIVMARAGLIKHLLGMPVHEWLVLLVMNSYGLFLTYLAVVEGRSV